MAGVWEGWRSPEGEVLRTFAIPTTAANATMRQLHRMPVIFEPGAWATWSGENGDEAADLMRRPRMTCCNSGPSAAPSTASGTMGRSCWTG